MNGIKLKQDFKYLPWIRNNLTFGEKISEDKRKKEWCCSLDKNDNVVWGKIQEKKDRERIVKHYTSRNIGEEITEFTRCQGCSIQNIQTMGEECIFRIHKKDLIGCRYLNNSKALKGDNVKLPCNTFTLENSAKEELMEKTNLRNRIPRPTFVTIIPWEIEDINLLVESEIYKQELTMAYMNNTNKSVEQRQITYEFYTDGFMYNRGQQKVIMGATWIQVKGPNPGS